MDAMDDDDRRRPMTTDDDDARDRTRGDGKETRAVV